MPTASAASKRGPGGASPAAMRAATGANRSRPVESGGEMFGPPLDLPPLARAGVAGGDGEEAVVGADEPAPAGARDDGAAVGGADARVDDAEHHAAFGQRGDERGEHIGGGLVPERRGGRA